LPNRKTDPLVSFTFMLDVQGAVQGLFTEISGLGSETDVIEQKAVKDGKEFIIKTAGRLKFTDVTLKRGVTAEMDIWKWRALVEQGNMEGARKSASIFMLDHELAPVAQWDLTNCWPTKVTGPSFKSDDNSFGIEEVTITFEFMERKS